MPRRSMILRRRSSEHLRNWTGPISPSRIVDHNGALWYHKPLATSDAVRRELLAFRLGAGLVNVAEVVPAPPHLAAREPHSVLVRLASEHKRRSLPHRTLDEAVAGEIVFSLWTRRRDAHLYNREYVGGVPVFFDHGASLEPRPTPIGEFLASSDPGYAGSWRLAVEHLKRRASTEQIRDQYWSSADSLHFVSSVAGFVAAARSVVQQVTGTHGYYTIARGIGYSTDEAAEIDSMLTRSRRSLADDLETLLAGIRVDADCIVGGAGVAPARR